MHKLKNEAALFKEALLAGVKYAEGRGVVEFEASDSASGSCLYLPTAGARQSDTTLAGRAGRRKPCAPSWPYGIQNSHPVIIPC